MTALPAGRLGQLLALALPLVFLISLYELIAWPLLDWHAERAGLIETRQDLLERLRAASEELPRLRARAAELQAASGSPNIMLEGANDTIAMANLQSQVEQLASSAGAHVGSTESLPLEKHEDYRRIGLRFVLQGSFESLMSFLAKLEASSTPVIVEGLQLHAASLRGRGERIARLDAGVEVYGLRPNATSSAAPR